MGYVSIALTREMREGSLPKSGCTEAATVAMDPLGSVTVRLGTTPQGQGHQTVAAQIVADELGVRYDDIEVIAEMDTQTSPWSIASGSYSSRFAPIASAAIQAAARKVATKLRTLAARELDVAIEDVVLTGGKAVALGDEKKSVPVKRLAGLAHWNPVALPPGMEPGVFETAYFSLPILAPPSDDDTVDSSAVYGFLADICYVTVDAETGRVNVEQYVTVHDCGTVLNPKLVDGQIQGGFAHGLGGALFEEMAYNDDGALLSGTLADYLIPTATEMPPLRIGHENVPSPFTPLGAKGVGEGNSMSVPVVIANAVADALGLDDVTLPLTPGRVWSLLARRAEAAP
jgi:2-furoyl-CoA dehydrogenase large subunit